MSDEPTQPQPRLPSEEAPNEDALTQAVGNLTPDDTDTLPPPGSPPPSPGSSASTPAPRKPTIVLCPYCGHTQRTRGKSDHCDVCGGLFEPLSRKATQIAMGPWFLRDQRNPFRPGCSFDVIKRLLEQQKIGPTTVLRGPTTRQFWSIARNIPGLAHHLGYCHACRQKIEPDLPQCPLCEAEFKDPPHRNQLGLTYPNRRAAQTAQRSLDRQLDLLQGKDIVGIDNNGDPVEHHPEPPPPQPTAPLEKDEDHEPADLLDDALGIDTAPASRPQDVSPLDFTPDNATQEPPEPTHQTPPPAITTTPPKPWTEQSEAPDHAPTHTPNNNNPTPRSWTAILLVSLNLLVALAILAYFLFRPTSP